MPTASPTFLPKIPNTLKTPKTPKKAALRIFWEDREESPPSGLPPVSSGLSPDTTLSELFDRYFLPVYLRSTMADPKTIAEYRTAIRLWCKFVWDPPLRLIDNAACAAFVFEDLNRENEKPISPNTVRKHLTHLQMVLHAAGPQTKQYPWAASQYGLFGDDPFGRPKTSPWFIKPPEREKPAEDGLTLDEIGRLLDVCPTAIKPAIPECPAPLWWRMLLLFGYNTGLRRGSLLALRRSWIQPFADAGLLSLPGRASKKKLPKLIYVNPEAMAALEQMPTGDLVFPWTESMASFNRYRRQLWEAAEVPPAHKFHGLRKAIGSELYAIDPKAAQLQLGHQSERTTRRSYVCNAAAAASLAENVGRASRRVRQPHSKPKPASGQKTLF